ncbi:uncharacterized protein BO72DRAFT_447986 [Aspergillus fijiensis CBS 313.89]|uniref:Uncharacterized protein n=1 Tax=Aspergillus fijiensis CBS 313.89 TaxID=1448319 RepID=A0A8G1VZD0_9EURO|nr:uncharacterized protein BO72DRAFT_447986 [Aspergillus fijiensis CBS 313.89]RAK77206.1 hypothetical protein BO72DRAFT_447986 [Aspergillus fijiensis CBS 313.89]
MADSSRTEEKYELVFEPDHYAEEELDDPEPINKDLISDTTVRDCRVIASVRCVEYGKIGAGDGILLVFAFVFHPVRARVKEADIELQFNNRIISTLQPQEINDRESEVTIRNKLEGRFDLSHPPVTVGLTASQERERVQSYTRSIRGSGVETELAIWTLRENSDQRGGVHLDFIAVVILKGGGEVEVDIEVRAQLGANLKDPLGIRKIISQRSIKFDGGISRGRRPEGLIIPPDLFVKDPM